MYVLNNDMNEIIKNVKPLKDLGVLSDEATKTVKHKIRKEEGRFLEAC